MFCPKCGAPEQQIETYCRQCGLFLPDFSKPAKKKYSAEENLKVNTVLTLMTVIVCFSLAFLLYLVLAFRPETHPLIYITAGLLLAMGGWHIQTFIRTRKLKKQWRSRRGDEDLVEDLSGNLLARSTAKLLQNADYSNAVPASITERTTNALDAKLGARKSPQT